MLNLAKKTAIHVAGYKEEVREIMGLSQIRRGVMKGVLKF